MIREFWFLIVLVLNFIGLLIYLVLRKPRIGTDSAGETAGAERVWPRLKRALTIMLAGVGIMIAWAVADELHRGSQIKRAPEVGFTDVGAHCDQYVVARGWVKRVASNMYVLEEDTLEPARDREAEARRLLGRPASIPVGVMFVPQSMPTLSNFVEVHGQVKYNDSLFGNVPGLIQESWKSVTPKGR